MKPTENTEVQPLGDMENSKSYVKVKLGMSGNVEITIKAGDDATKELMDSQREFALEQLKELLNHEDVKDRVGIPKKAKSEAPF